MVEVLRTAEDYIEQKERETKHLVDDAELGIRVKKKYMYLCLLMGCLW
jgi:hypothetical protein